MKRRNGSHKEVLVTLLIACTVVCRSALAQGDRAAEAEALFREGKRLLEQQDFTQACPKLAESYRLDPATGALLALAVCHEAQGRIATAWAEYGDVASRSKTEGRSDREQAARQKIEALGAKLSTLTIVVAPDVAELEGFRVRRDGAAVGFAVWGVAIPVDPGPHVVEATVLGGGTWRTTQIVGTPGDKRIVVVPNPAKTAEDSELEKGARADGPSTPLVRAPRPPAGQLRFVAAGAVSPSPGTSKAPNGVLPYVGISAIVGGGMLLGIGGYYVTRALSNKSEYESDPGCAYDCPALDAANSASNYATGFLIAGAVLLGSGIALYAFAPRVGTKDAFFLVAPVVSAGNCQLTAIGRF
jgi:hypothetical protein